MKCIATTCILFCLASSVSAQTWESEPNDWYNQTNAIPATGLYAGTAVSGNSDFWRFPAGSSGEITVTLAYSASEVHLLWFMECGDADCNDLKFQTLLDPYDGSNNVTRTLNPSFNYLVQIDSWSGTTQNYQFQISGPASLPVELVSFTATANGNAALLRWETASETNNAGFSVETLHATSLQWHELAFVAGHGTTTEARAYAFAATNLTPGTHRFRLKQVAFDGQFEYSPVVEVLVGLDEAALIEVWGRSIRFAVRVSQPIHMEAFDVLGRRVALLVDGQAEAGSMQRIEMPPEIAAGVYLVRVRGRSFSETARVVVH